MRNVVVFVPAPLLRNKPLISPHSTFPVDFKGLQHPRSPGAHRVQKKTSKFSISRRAEISAPISSCTLTTATSVILNCSKSDSFVTCLKTFPQTDCLSYSRSLPSFTSVRADWLVAPRWSHHRAAVKPMKRWIFRHHLYTLAQIGRQQLFHWKGPFEHIEITFDPSESFCPDHLRSLSQRYRIFLPASPQILFHICVITLKSRHVQATTYRSVEVHLLSPTSTDDCWYCCC